jgi:hypothetical protein
MVAKWDIRSAGQDNSPPLMERVKKIPQLDHLRWASCIQSTASYHDLVSQTVSSFHIHRLEFVYISHIPHTFYTTQVSHFNNMSCRLSKRSRNSFLVFKFTPNSVSDDTGHGTLCTRDFEDASLSNRHAAVTTLSTAITRILCYKLWLQDSLRSVR